MALGEGMKFRRDDVYDERFVRPVAAVPMKVESSGGGLTVTVHNTADPTQIAQAVSNTVQLASTKTVAGTSSGPFGLGYQHAGSLYPATTQSACPQHEMGDETELEDGRVVGSCVRCGDSIVGRRMVGGLGLARLKTALVDALGDEGAMPSLADELNRVEMMLELEEQGLEDARRLIETSKRMILTLMKAAAEVE